MSYSYFIFSNPVGLKLTNTMSSAISVSENISDLQVSEETLMVG